MRATKVWASWEGKAHAALYPLLRRPVPQTVPGRLIDPDGYLGVRNNGLERFKKPVGRPPVIEKPTDETKICSKCEDPKPLTDFYRDSKSRDGRKPSCKECC